MKEKLKYIKELIKNGLKEFKKETKKMFKEFFNKDTNKKQRANMWTFSRLIIPIITIITSILAICTSAPLLFIGSGLIAGFGAITDYFDGKSSRKHKSTSQYGKLLDQISDKIFTGIIGINLLFLNPNYISVLFFELFIAGINLTYKLKHNELDIDSTKMGKIKSWPLYITLALGFLSPISPILLNISNFSILATNFFQIATGFSYVNSNEKAIEKLKQTNNDNVTLVIEDEKDSKDKELVKSNEKEITKLEQYKNLRNALNEIIVTKTQEQTDELNIDGHQKIKEL